MTLKQNLAEQLKAQSDIWRAQVKGLSGALGTDGRAGSHEYKKAMEQMEAKTEDAAKLAEQVRSANEAAWKDMVTASQKAFAELQGAGRTLSRFSDERDERVASLIGHNRSAWLNASGTMPMKIKAAVLNKMGVEAPYAKSKPLAIEEVELDDPGHGEVLVRIAAAGLCHSDLSVIEGNRPRPTPMVLGHEAAGIVEKLGPGVDDLEVGDHVVMVFVPSCGHCLPCAEGRPALCEPGAAANGAGTLLSGQRRLHRNGSEVHHHLGVLGFRGICDGFAPLAGENRQGVAARGGGLVRMRRSHRRRRRDQHRQGLRPARAWR